MSTLKEKLELARQKMQASAATAPAPAPPPAPPPTPPPAPPAPPPLPSMDVALAYRDPRYCGEGMRAATFAARIGEGLAEKRRRAEGAVPATPDATEPPVDVLGTRFGEELGTADDYIPEQRISEGTYGVVFRARHRATGEVFALKQIRADWARDIGSGFPAFLLREFDLQMRLNHPNVVRGVELRTRVVQSTGVRQVYVVMEYCPRDLKQLIYHDASFHVRSANAHHDAPLVFLGKAKEVVRQLLTGLAFLHEADVLHRDIKCSNVLVGADGTVKFCDFGLARFFREGDRLSGNVVTLMYRAPELHFGVLDYGRAVDVWSIGCVMAELFLKAPLFPASTDMEHFRRVCDVLGAPSNATFPGLMHLPETRRMLTGLVAAPSTPQLRSIFANSGRATARVLDDAGFDLLLRLLAWNPRERISAADALKHAWLTTGAAPCGPGGLSAPMPFAADPATAQATAGGAAGGAPTSSPHRARGRASAELPEAPPAAASPRRDEGGCADADGPAEDGRCSSAAAPRDGSGADSSQMQTPREGTDGSLKRALLARGDDSIELVATDEAPLPVSAGRGQTSASPGASAQRDP